MNDLESIELPRGFSSLDDLAYTWISFSAQAMRNGCPQSQALLTQLVTELSELCKIALLQRIEELERSQRTSDQHTIPTLY